MAITFGSDEAKAILAVDKAMRSPPDPNKYVSPNGDVVIREPGLGVSVYLHDGRHLNFWLENLTNTEYIRRAKLVLSEIEFRRKHE